MASRSRSCKNHPDSFCYICGEFKITDERNRVTEFIQKAYCAYFGIQLGDQDKPWSPCWIPNPGVLCSKPFHPSEVNKMSTRNFWELSGKK